jgi:hypothetical protein
VEFNICKVDRENEKRETKTGRGQKTEAKWRPEQKGKKLTEHNIKGIV